MFLYDCIAFSEGFNTGFKELTAQKIPTCEQQQGGS